MPQPEVSATLRQLAEQSRLHADSDAGDAAGPLDESMLERCIAARRPSLIHVHASLMQ